MQIFRDLILRGDSDQLAATVSEIEHTLNGCWTRDKAEEMRIQSLANQEPIYCFRGNEKGRPAATIFLRQKEPGTLFVSNVVPRNQYQLSLGEYNGILEDFFEVYVRPAADRMGARAELTAAEAELKHWLPAAAAEKLRSFFFRRPQRHRGRPSTRPGAVERLRRFGTRGG